MMNGRKIKDSFYEQFGRIGKAVSSPKRLEILDILCQGERSVEDIAHETSQSIANASQHLQVLKTSGLVEARKDGLRVMYSLADQEVCEFFQALQNLAKKRLAEVDRVIQTYFVDPEELEPIDRRELMKRARKGQVTVLDVRPEEEYQSGHIPGAISLPLGELEKHLKEIPNNREIVAYCRGPYCLLAVKAVEILREHGYKARRLEDGVPQWRAQGLEVESGK